MPPVYMLGERSSSSYWVWANQRVGSEADRAQGCIVGPKEECGAGRAVMGSAKTADTRASSSVADIVT